MVYAKSLGTKSILCRLKLLYELLLLKTSGLPLGHSVFENPSRFTSPSRLKAGL